MKKIIIKSFRKATTNYRSSDWKDIDGLLSNFDEELKLFDLELEIGNFGDDNNWIRVIKRKVKNENQKDRSGNYVP